MNVFDFDKTVYDGDSTVDFWKFCLKRYKKTRRCLPYQAMIAVPFGLHLMKKTAFKERFYRFLSRVPDMDEALNAFWNEHRGKLKSWYLEMKQPTDVIISASPTFLLQPICAELGVQLLASVVDPKTGKYTGINCHGQEKVRRFYEAYPDGCVNAFYSDAYCDTPLSRIAENAYLVKGNAIRDWDRK